MHKALLILLGLAGILRAEDGGYDEMRISNALAQWHTETNSEAKAKLEAAIVHQCGVADTPEIVEELVGGRPLEQTRLVFPAKEKSLPLTALKEWDFILSGFYQLPDEVIRRIGPKNFELWTPKQGWLFDEKGSTLAEAKVPRRDGTGREWHGAFLPDGQWITTDLWAQDDRIYIFSPGNKLLRAFPTKKYTGKAAHDWDGHAVAWARADKTGKQWVAQIGLDGGWCGLLISPWDWQSRLSAALAKMHLPSPSSWVLARKVDDPKTFVNQRTLGSRGSSVNLTASSEEGKSSLEYCGHMHGSETELPTYSMRGGGAGWPHVIPEVYKGKYTGRGNFGFFPNSQVAWVGGNKDPIRPNQQKGGFRTWIIAPDGKALGWLPAERVGDDPDGKRMWFVDEQGRLLKVAPDGSVSEVLQPTFSDAAGDDTNAASRMELYHCDSNQFHTNVGSSHRARECGNLQKAQLEETPFAHVLFPDLKLGFFYTKPGHLVLARWN